jgi:hypothetical protein
VTGGHARQESGLGLVSVNYVERVSRKKLAKLMECREVPHRIWMANEMPNSMNDESVDRRQAFGADSEFHIKSGSTLPRGKVANVRFRPTVEKASEDMQDAHSYPTDAKRRYS